MSDHDFAWLSSDVLGVVIWLSYDVLRVSYDLRKRCCDEFLRFSHDFVLRCSSSLYNFLQFSDYLVCMKKPRLVLASYVDKMGSLVLRRNFKWSSLKV